jgi:predicted transcriptional regulator
MATRMQQRRGTATQWTTANPILSAGEIGFETDTGQFKMGDGITNWADLSYFKNLEDLGGSLDDYILLTEKGAANGVATLDGAAAIPVSQLSNIIQGSPEALDTLNEIAGGLTDLTTYVDDQVADFVTDITALQTTAGETTTALNDAVTDIGALQGLTSTHTTEISTANTAIAAVAGDLDTTNGQLSSLQTQVNNIATTNVAEGTNLYFTNERAQDAVASITSGSDGILVTYNDSANTIVVSADSSLATTTGVESSISTHNSDTTSVHGIADTSALVVTTDSRLSDTRTPTDNTVSTAKLVDGAVTSAKIADGTIVNADINGSAAIATSKISGLDTALAAKAPLAAPALTGNATAENLTISGNLTVNGTTTTVSSANLELTDSLIYLSSTQYDTDVVDIGIFGAYGDSGAGHFHTGLVRDASDGKWKLISGGSEPTSNVVDFSTATYDTVKLGGVEFSDGVQVKQGVPSLTAINQQTGAYTPVLTDRDKMIEISSASGVTVTIPTNASVAYPVGTSFDILQTGAGQITIAGAAGVTVNATPGLKLRTQWSSATLFKRATDTWVVYGDLSA